MLHMVTRIILGLVLSALLCCVGAATNIGLGANADEAGGIPDYYDAAVFVDAMKQSRQFGLQRQPWVTTNITYDSVTGIPIDMPEFGAIMFDVPNPLNDMDGVWTLRVTGANATISSSLLNPGCCSEVYNTKYDPSAKVTTANMNCNQTLCKSYDLDLMFTINSGTATNIEAIRPGYPITNYPMFTNAYLKMLSGFNTIRFMDWADTNSNIGLYAWSQRSTLANVQWGVGKGIPWEAVIELCNTIGANAWINIPLNATDDYMVQMAQLFKEKLNPNLIIYVEFSNEPWNYAFPVGQITVNEAQKYNATGNYNFLNFDKSNNIWYMGYRWYVWRAMNASNAFRSVFGDSAMMSRIRPVINSQVGGLQIDVGLSMVDACFKPSSYYFFGAAIAPYFGSANSSATENELYMQVNQSAWDQMKNVLSSLVVAKKYGLELLCYEGGPGVPGMINYDTRMTETIMKYSTNMWSIGVLLFNYYSVGPTVVLQNYWGTGDDMYNFSNPKYVALRNLIFQDQNPTTFPIWVPEGVIDPINASNTIIPQKEEQGWPSSWDLSRWQTWQYNFVESLPNGAYYEMTFTAQVTAHQPLNMSLFHNDKLVSTFILKNSTAMQNTTFTTFLSFPRVNVLMFVIDNFPSSGASPYLYMQRTSATPPPYVYPPLTYSSLPLPLPNENKICLDRTKCQNLRIA